MNLLFLKKFFFILVICSLSFLLFLLNLVKILHYHFTSLQIFLKLLLNFYLNVYFIAFLILQLCIIHQVAFQQYHFLNYQLNIKGKFKVNQFYLLLIIHFIKSLIKLLQLIMVVEALFIYHFQLIHVKLIIQISLQYFHQQFLSIIVPI